MDSAEFESVEPEAKRRRLRKGTHSCWECKRRKVRCTFASTTDSICIICQRRGTNCISQDLPDEPSQVEDSAGRIVRVEALLNKLVQKVNHRAVNDGSESVSDEIRVFKPAAPTPATEFEATSVMSLNEYSPAGNPSANESASTQHPWPALLSPESLTPASARPAPSDASKHEKISQALLATFPSHRDIEIVLNTGRDSTLFCHQVNVKSRTQLDREGLQEEVKLAEVASTQTHPVLIAKQMLIFSLLLLHFQPLEKIAGVSEHHRVIMERLADTAINLVTTNEELLGTIESLECILLEGFYHLDCGNIRRAWLAYRRAMGAAQLMGIQRPSNPPVKTIDPTTTLDPQFVWYRIVSMDRFLSLLLGLPTANSDMDLGADTTLLNGAPSDRLDLVHTRIAAKILERNQLGPCDETTAMTLEIDRELLEAAEGLPSGFWRPPNFSGLVKDTQQAFWESQRVRDQMFHYTLLNQLHLPYLLCPSVDRKFEYSRVTGVNASREILTRFVVFRNFNPISSCCRLADFLALVAGMTLMLAHLDNQCNHRPKETNNLLAHQRLGDRATVEQALENMEVKSKLNNDMLAARCARLLEHMLHIEGDAAQSQTYSTEKVQLADNYEEHAYNALLVTVPYFGTIRIAREGISSMPPLNPSTHQTQDLGGHIELGGIGSVRVTGQLLASGSNQPSTDVTTRTQTGELPTISDTAQMPSVAFSSSFMQQQDLYPGVAAGIDDWVFQGVDTAFFDNLLRGANVQGDGEGNAGYGQGPEDGRGGFASWMRFP